jgi:hypothetical protein
MKPLIVAEAPSRTSNPAEPLSGRSGRRLADFCGLSHSDFLETFERINIFDDVQEGFPLLKATIVARDRVLPKLYPGRRVVLFRRPAYAVERALLQAGYPAARDLSFANFIWHHVRLAPPEVVAFACSPHPSARARFWNDPENEEAAKRFWRKLAAGSSRVPSPR